MPTPALFLDRDGVINENRAGYVRSWADVAIYPEAPAALARLRDLPIKLIIVTNQSAIGRGLVSAGVVDNINRRLVDVLCAAGGRVDGVYVCPHHPDDGCDCRKPRPGLLRRAARDHDLDLGASIMIGDALTDIRAGREAGVGEAVLLCTGRGADQLNLPEAAALKPFPVYKNLAAALADLFP